LLADFFDVEELGFSLEGLVWERVAGRRGRNFKTTLLGLFINSYDTK
jgi:hypothetical protein